MHDTNLCDNCLEEEYESFAHECIHESIAKNERWLEHYKIHSWPRWDYSTDEATITFSQDGVPKVVCQMQVVGTVEGDSWEWSWGNKNFPESCKKRMSDVRDFGLRKEWKDLTSLFLESNEYLGWKCASIASHILDGLFVYRCPGDEDGHFVYLVILSAEFVEPHAIQ